MASQRNFGHRIASLLWLATAGTVLLQPGCTSSLPTTRQGWYEGEVYLAENRGNFAFRHRDQHSAPVDLVVAGAFRGAGRTDILFYRRGSGGSIFSVESDGRLARVRTYPDWRDSWDTILAGQFGGDRSTDLLFYDRLAGEGQIYFADPGEGLRLVRTYPGWRKTWDRVVPGDFNGDGLTDVLFYDGRNREGEFYTSDGVGGLAFLIRHSGWRRNWSHIVPCDLNRDPYTDLLFFSSQSGQAQFFATRRDGTLQLVRQWEGWRRSWTHIVPGEFGGEGGFTDLLFYDSRRGEGELYFGQGDGGLALGRMYRGWRRTWSGLVAGFFNGDGLHDLYFEDGAYSRPPLPLAPSDLQVGSVTETTMHLSWMDNSVNEDGFEISWDGSHALRNGTRVLPEPDRETAVLDRLSPGVRYCVEVRAFNESGRSSPSNLACRIVGQPELTCSGLPSANAQHYWFAFESVQSGCISANAVRYLANSRAEALECANRDVPPGTYSRRDQGRPHLLLRHVPGVFGGSLHGGPERRQLGEHSRTVRAVAMRQLPVRRHYCCDHPTGR